ncbi:hypothetical protein [Wolbachia endosymbiont (group B) of Episyrphus balteatus]|uniref:hypothetical protein n=1 Tax=Wolbachia endosymbiont (group B) of Episyrphus balteatus TaxID=2954009 RepID=UPI002227A0ED|nr:hypothetical protein [Wolbachia endosymbiont (group B) of Episyrphus balteatus]
MSKSNAELYFGEGDNSNDLAQFQKLKFNKLTFLTPEIDTVTEKKTKMQFDITKEMSKDDINKIPFISIDAKYLKKFYDGLMKSIDKYNTDLNNQIENGIVKSLSATIDTIGKNTKTINDKLQKIRSDFDDFTAEQPGSFESFPRLSYATGEENGLL